MKNADGLDQGLINFKMNGVLQSNNNGLIMKLVQRPGRLQTETIGNVGWDTERGTTSRKGH